jgi:hypothetical protein
MLGDQSPPQCCGQRGHDNSLLTVVSMMLLFGSDNFGREPSGGDVFLTRPATWPFPRYDDTADEQLAAPDTPWLAPLEGSSKAEPAHGAVAAE